MYHYDLTVDGTIPLAAGPPDVPARRLTRRQREVLVAIASGASTRSIARRLGVSAKTVETHRAAIYGRLGIDSVAGLVLYAVRQGLVDPGRPGGT